MMISESTLQAAQKSCCGMPPSIHLIMTRVNRLHSKRYGDEKPNVGRYIYRDVHGADVIRQVVPDDLFLMAYSVLDSSVLLVMNVTYGST